MAATETPRRRRRPEEARAEILEAADKLLRERPLLDVSVDEIMRGTTLSRKSFYVYFDDRYELLTELFKPLRAELDAANAVWTEGSGDALGEGRESLLRVARVMVRDGLLIRALHEASHHDARARRVWRRFHEPVIKAFAERLGAEIRSGRAPELDPEATARALIGMNLFRFFDELAGNPRADVDAVVDSLHRVWLRVLTLPGP